MARRIETMWTSGGDKADADLLAEMHMPDSEALSALCGRYTRLVHRVAAAILRDEGEAEDVTQEVFLEVYRKSHLYEPSRGAVRVWLLQYAYSRSLRRRRTLRRRAAYGGEPLEGVDIATVNGRHGLTRQECRWVIQTGLAQLTERQRATVELACLHDASLHDVAEQLRVSFGCARHHYYRGLARLRAWAHVSGALPESGSHRPGPSAVARQPITRTRGRQPRGRSPAA